MTVWVVRDGKLVDKATLSRPRGPKSDLASPRVSRFESMTSPVTEKTISSWRERDRDMHAANAVDPRDLDRKPFVQREQDIARRAELKPTYRDRPDT